MTIQDQYLTCKPEYGTARVQQLDGYGDEYAGLKVWLRPHEGIYIVLGTDPLRQCSVTHKQVVHIMACWDHRITSDSHRDGPGTWRYGEDRFSVYRHADGTTCEGRTSCFLRTVCTSCNSFDSIELTLEAYYDRHTCRVCGDEWLRPIGD